MAGQPQQLPWAFKARRAVAVCVIQSVSCYLNNAEVFLGMQTWHTVLTVTLRCGATLLLVALSKGEAGADQVIDRRLAQISSAIAQGDPLNAKRLADASLAIPGLSREERSLLLSNRALANNLMGRTKEALADYKKATESGALTKIDEVAALLERGLVLESLHRLEDATRDYSAVLRLEPHSLAALDNRADVYRRLNRIAEAKQDYLVSLASSEISPEHSYYGLGKIAEAQGDVSSARTYFEMALKANPDFPLATVALNSLSNISADSTTPNPTGASAARKSESYVLEKSNSSFEQPAKDGPRLRSTIGVSRKRSIPQEVQLGAWRTEDEAAAGWTHAMKLAGSVLAAAHPSIVPAEVPDKGQYFRLRVHASISANQFCEMLRAKGVDCLAVSD